MRLDHFVEGLKGVLGDLYNPAVMAFKVISIIIITFLVVKLGSYIIKKIFEKQKSFKYNLDAKKIDTMASLLVSIFKYAVYIIAGVIIFTDVFRLTSILAAAGIGGVAIGLGAQSLIKDVIAGFFIVMEDHYAVGDLITIEGMNGTVEEMELRVTKLRNFNGDLYIIPNGEIKRVTNHTRGNKAVIVDIPIAYSSDLERAVKAAEAACQAAAKEFGTIVEQPKVQGVTELGKESLNLRIFARTLPNSQWDVERRIRMLVKEEFDKENVKFYDRNIILPASSQRNTGEGVDINA